MMYFLSRQSLKLTRGQQIHLATNFYVSKNSVKLLYTEIKPNKLVSVRAQEKKKN